MKIASIIIAIIAGFLGLPAALCAGACAAGLSAAGDASRADSNSAGTAFMFFGVLSALFAIIGGILTKNPGRKGPVLQAIALFLALLTCVTLNPISFFVALLLLVSTVLGFIKKDLPVS